LVIKKEIIIEATAGGKKQEKVEIGQLLKIRLPKCGKDFQ
jgi:hypothetical protein